MTGAARVAKATPDGYTFLIGQAAPLSYNQTLYKKPLYNAVTDFEPVGLVVGTAKVLIARKDFPANTLPEFVAYAKANQDKLQYGSAGAGSGTHVSCVLLNVAMGDQRHPRALSRRRSGHAGPDRRAHRLHVRADCDRAARRSRRRRVKAIAMLSLRSRPA